MFPVLPSAVDNLTASGVIDFDAESFIKGEPPRYVGAPPKLYLPFETPLMQPQGVKQLDMPQMHQQPKKDEFVHKSEIPAWKKVLFGGMIAGAVVAGVMKLKKVDFSKIKTFISNVKAKIIK